MHALRDGGILVVVIILLFLANLRATFITLTAIPLSLLATVLTLQALGSTINTMTPTTASSAQPISSTTVHAHASPPCPTKGISPGRPRLF